jgi:hypothetical protein
MADDESDACCANNVENEASDVEDWEESASLERCERCCWRREIRLELESKLDTDMIGSFWRSTPSTRRF